MSNRTKTTARRRDKAVQPTVRLASIADVVKRLGRPWGLEIDDAKKGDPRTLIKALLSEKPLPDEREARVFRDTIAKYLRGDFKRSRGRPKSEFVPPSWRLVAKDTPRARAYCYVQSLRDQNPKRTEKEAIELASEKYRVPYDTILNDQHRSRQQRRSRKRHA